MREIVRADQPFVRSEVSAERRAGAVRRPAVQARDHRAGHRRRGRRPPRRRRGRRRRDGQRVPQLAGVRRHVPRAARAVHVAARLLQADEGRRGVLAGQREGPDAPADLRHGVGEQGRARRAPAPSGRGREARPPQAVPGARPAQLPPRARRRARRVAPQGGHRAQADGGLQPSAPPGRRLPVRLHAAPGQRQPVQDVRPPRLVRGRDVPADGDGQRHVLPEADELPDALPDLRFAPAQLPRAAAAPVRAGHGVPLRARRHAARADAHPRLHPGRQPHLLHGGPAVRGDRLAARLRHLRAARLRLRGLPVLPVHQGPEEVRRQRRDLGEGHRRAARSRSSATAWPTRSRRATPPSTARRSTSTSRTRSVGGGS